MAGPFFDRFEPNGNDDVLVRIALVQTEREHWIPERLLLRAWVIGRAYRLPVFSAFEYGADARFNPQQATRLSEEVAFIAEVTNDSLLGPHLQTLYNLAVEGGRTRGGLIVEWP